MASGLDWMVSKDPFQPEPSYDAQQRTTDTHGCSLGEPGLHRRMRASEQQPGIPAPGLGLARGAAVLLNGESLPNSNRRLCRMRRKAMTFPERGKEKKQTFHKDSHETGQNAENSLPYFQGK